jgi:aldose 1-epimerase
MQIEADEMTLGNKELLPDGTFAKVEGTAFDFRQPKSIGRDIDNDEEQLRFGGGYDHNFVLRSSSGELKQCARVYELSSGRVMTVETTLPGLQLYTGNMMKPVTGKSRAAYNFRTGFCLETQFFPNSLRHLNFPSPVFKAGEHFKHTTVYNFNVLSFDE